MPIIVTFDIERPTPQERNRIRGFFERLGWEHLGNTAYRYPKLHGQHPTEDWFNHGIPALMMLRAFARYAAARGRNSRKFSLDVQSGTGFNPVTNVGTLPLAAGQISYSQPSQSGRSFAQQHLETWIDGIIWPYPQPPIAPAAGTQEKWGRFIRTRRLHRIRDTMPAQRAAIPLLDPFHPPLSSEWHHALRAFCKRLAGS